jgi:hypothetical protein
VGARVLKVVFSPGGGPDRRPPRGERRTRVRGAPVARLIVNRVGGRGRERWGRGLGCGRVSGRARAALPAAAGGGRVSGRARAALPAAAGGLGGGVSAPAPPLRGVAGSRCRLATLDCITTAAVVPFFLLILILPFFPLVPEWVFRHHR